MNNQPCHRTHTVIIEPDCRHITAGDGDNLLSLLTCHAILLRTDCGGRGTCGKCRVEILDQADRRRSTTACTCRITGDMTIAIPEGSLLSPYIVDKAEIVLPPAFVGSSASTDDGQARYGIAVDLGTTTIAVYLVNCVERRILSSLAVKNPQSLHGDDVMSRIGHVGDSTERLKQLQKLTSGAIRWAIDAMVRDEAQFPAHCENMVVVGNPSMIHLLLGISPSSIGISPYSPLFYESRLTGAECLNLDQRVTTVLTLPQVSGFIGGDILAAALAVELAKKPPGTLLIDLGTNGELMLKADDGFFATSCATGPAFEGATISCGMQALPGAIDRITVDGDKCPGYTTITAPKALKKEPIGICGSGIISGIAAMLKAGVIGQDGALSPSLPPNLTDDANGIRRYLIHKSNSGTAVAVSQKDVRHVQLGKAALISGIEFLLAAAKIKRPRRILVAGAFGAHLDPDDLLTLGMLPSVDPQQVVLVGNAAGAGAIMMLCDEHCLACAEEMASRTMVINLAENPDFQNHFITRLSF